MPLPILVPIAMGIASAAGAIGSFVKGKSDMNRAKHKVRMSEENLEKAQKSIENKRKKVESAANELGSQKVEVYKYLRNEFIPFYKKYKNVNFNPGSLDQSISILPIKKLLTSLILHQSIFLRRHKGPWELPVPEPLLHLEHMPWQEP